MGSSSKPSRDSDCNGGIEVEIAAMLESVRLEESITNDKVDHLASMIQRKLGLSGVPLGDSVYLDMASSMLGSRLKELKLNGGERAAPSSPVKASGDKQPGLDAPTWSQESSSPEPLSPKVTTRKTKETPPRSPLPNPSSESRGRSPARSRYPNIPRPDRSRTPGGRGNNRGRSPGPASHGIYGCSRSPLPRQRSRSPFQARRSPSPLGRSVPPTASPSVFFDANMFDTSAPRETPTPQRQPKPSEAQFTNGRRPPLAYVNVDSNINVDSPAQPSATMPSSSGPMSEDADTAKARESFNDLRVDDIKFNIGVNSPKVSSPFHHGQSPSHRRQRRFLAKKSPRPAETTIPPNSWDPSAHDSTDSSLDGIHSTKGFPDPDPQQEPASERGRSPVKQDAGSATLDGWQPPRNRSRSPFQIFSRWRSPQGEPSPAEVPGDIHVDPGAPFVSPIPPFQAPQPENPTIDPKNDNSADMFHAAGAGRHQTAPSNITIDTGAAASAVSGTTPHTPYEFNATPMSGMDTADTAVKKKGRTTATPFISNDPTIPQFHVNLSPKSDKGGNSKGKSKRGGIMNGLRRGIGSRRAGNYQAIPPSDSESPSNVSIADARNSPASMASSMDIDGNSPFPPNQPEQQASVPDPGVNVQFNLGVGDLKSPSSKLRGKRRERNPRAIRTQYGRSQSVSYAESQAGGMHQATSSGWSNTAETTGEQVPHHGRSQSLHETTAANRETLLSMKRASIMSLREEGKSHYIAKDYRASIRTYTEAIKRYMSDCLEQQSNDLLSVLLSNRAAGLLMIGACQAAAEDCEKALSFVSDPSIAAQSSDGGPVLRPKLFNRMARALIKLGKVDSAERSFCSSVESANVALALLSATDCGNVQIEVTRKGLEQVIQEATLGQADASSLRETMNELLVCTERAAQTSSKTLAREKNLEALAHVNSALLTATGCDSLHEQKIALLASLKRWREVGSHCERLAASNTKFDGCFDEDLATKHPFSGVKPAKFLDPNYFGDAREDEMSGAELKLNSKSASEAVLRIPTPLIAYYVRSLRLEERYPAAEAAIRSVEHYLRERSAVFDQGGLRNVFDWLPKESERLTITRIEREKGDELFRKGEFSLAARQYASCLRIDSDGTDDGSSAGGRLHAVLHCNRAACLMAEKKFQEAMTECTAALRIHPRYMKALLRRARCYSRLDRLEESAVEFQRWVDMVKQAKKDPKSMPVSTSPCLFDGPHEISDEDLTQVKGELSDVLKAKAKAAAAERAEAHYSQQRQRWQEEKWSSQAGGDANSRREYYYSQHFSSRRWDSFADRGPKRSTKNNGHAAPPPAQERKSPRSFVNEKNHYKVLGINSDASDSDIKKAYRKLALKYHPDKNKNKDSGTDEIFRRVKEAYETLNDPALRRKYDQESRWRMRF